MKKIAVWLENLNEMVIFLKRDSISKLMEEEIENLDWAIRTKYMKMIEILPLQTCKPMQFMSTVHQVFKEELISVLYKLYQKIEKNHIYDLSKRNS